MTVGIIDYGMGNLLSVKNALEILGAEVSVCTQPQDIYRVDKIVLPGVGAFTDCMSNLHSKGFVEALNENVMKGAKPILGICLGMQVMARKGDENGGCPGLGWFDAEVVRLTPQDSSLRIPHIGWNNIAFNLNSPLFGGLPESPDVYFVHSYYMKCGSADNVDATFDYSGTFTAAVRKNNIMGTQFHPEKSQDIGLKILDNFLRWNP